MQNLQGRRPKIKPFEFFGLILEPTAKVSALSLLFVLPPSSLLVAGTMSRMSMSLGYLLNWKGSCQLGSQSMVSIKEPGFLYKLRLSVEDHLFSTVMKWYCPFLYDEMAMKKRCNQRATMKNFAG